VDAEVDLHADEGKESGVSLEGLVVGPDDGHFFLDIREGHAEEGVECLEDEAEFIEDGAELCEGDLFLVGVGGDYGGELKDHPVDVELLHSFYNIMQTTLHVPFITSEWV